MLEYLHLVSAAPADSLLYAGHYDPVLVSLSVIIAIFASYAALLVSQHVITARSKGVRRGWLLVGGLCLGLGIWAMHFVGMLAFSLPCTTSYDSRITFLSTIPGVLACTLALSVVGHRQITPIRLATGGLLLGTGIGAMHYSGMSAMHFDGMIRYDLKLLLLSIVVTVGLATLALWLKFRLTSWRSGWNPRSPVISASVLGLAVAGMHYAAMADAYFIRDGGRTVDDLHVGAPFLAAIVVAATSVIIVVTIVATYVGKHKLFSLERSYKLVGLAIVGWGVVTSLGVDHFHHIMVKDLYEQELQLARQQADSVANNIEGSLHVLKGIPLLVVRDDSIHRVLRDFGAHVPRSTIAYETRKRQWTRDTRLAAVNKSLNMVSINFQADSLWILNAAGDCIASYNAGQPDSYVGTYYGDRGFFQEAKAGRRGFEYLTGRVRKVPGLSYSYPIIENGRFLGAIVVRREISRLAVWTDPNKAFLSDANGVIILAADKKLVFRTMPDARIGSLSMEQRLAQYRQSRFETLPITPWGEPHLPFAVRIGDEATPFVLSTKGVADDAIAVHVARPLSELPRLGAQRFWVSLLITFAGGMLIVSAALIVLYLRETEKAEIDLRVAATAFESQQGMVITDEANITLRINQAFTDITGYTAGDVVGRELNMFDSGRHDAGLNASIWQSIHRDGSWQGEAWNRRKNGELFPESLTVTGVKDAAGNVTHYVVALTDITQRKAAEEEIKNLALYDSLTHLPNRRFLLELLEHALAASARSGRQGALLFIDLDNFKDLNDTMGHNMGDQLLQQVAQRFISCVRESDTVARLGGDEFIVMLENLGEGELEPGAQVEHVGEKILARLAQPYLLDNHQYNCSSSIGVTLFLGHGKSVESLLKQADLAMYQAKAAGRNTQRFFDPGMLTVVTARAALDADLRLGLQQSQFQLYYQPQVDGEGSLTGAEALLRWQHPQRGLVSPAEFIPAAEVSGLILPLGHWVLETACLQLKAWSSRPETAHLNMAVNVSPRQFRQPDFVDQVLATLERIGADPCKLKLELTETLLLDDVEQTIAKMVVLNAHGVGLSLDDFGTGYSSLSYLKRLPICQLKIDRSFVRDITGNPSDAAITKTILTLAQSMGLTAIAEGVETEAQRDFLASQGCVAFQGYLFGRPLPLEEFEQLFEQLFEQFLSPSSLANA